MIIGNIWPPALAYLCVLAFFCVLAYFSYLAYLSVLAYFCTPINRQKYSR